jgi:hypothetical protein
MFDMPLPSSANPDSSAQAQYEKALNEAYRFPSVENFAAIARSFPELHLWNASPGLALIPTADARQELGPDVAAFSSLLMGRADLAAEVICQKVGRLMDACGPHDVATANRIRNAQYLLGTIISTPKIAQGILGATLSAVMGGDEFEERFTSVFAGSPLSAAAAMH